MFFWQDFFGKNQNKKKLQKGKWKLTNLPWKTFKYSTNSVFDRLITKPFSNNDSISSFKFEHIFIWDIFFVRRNAPLWSSPCLRVHQRRQIEFSILTPPLIIQKQKASEAAQSPLVQRSWYEEAWRYKLHIISSTIIKVTKWILTVVL